MRGAGSGSVRREGGIANTYQTWYHIAKRPVDRGEFGGDAAPVHVIPIMPLAPANDSQIMLLYINSMIESES